MRYILFFLFFIPSLAFADTNVDYFGYTLKAFGSLVLVLGIIFVFFYLTKRLNSLSRASNSRIKMKSRLYLDNKHYLSIVEIDKREFLIGVGENVNLLKELKNEKD
ncbi:flagellar biosynthetic protein FliO [Hippea alviniae]|uniref:flagellar biosynthetic protein FliO n=1 Tax=Hippea alviniae TaxID=1279027 RepID=UPI0003B43A69|nr:flagellar biosynthetic protein FliO [Hippea alviniae]